MSALTANDRLEFGPPPIPGSLRSFALAVLAHAFLVAALTWGVHWRNDSVTVMAEAELWSAVPQQAAPRLVEVAPEPPAPPPPPVAAPVETPKPAEVDIALEREKLRLKKEKLDKLALEKQQLKNEKLERDKLRLKNEKLALEKKRLQDKQAALEKQRKDAQQAQQDAKRLEGMRQENLKRISGLAGATGAEGSNGTALKSSGPSASYAGKIVERIKANTKFADPNAGRPTVKVMVRVTNGGSILSRVIVTPSGNKAWDDAVLRAIDKIDPLPRDTDGTIPGIVVREGLELTVSL